MDTVLIIAANSSGRSTRHGGDIPQQKGRPEGRSSFRVKRRRQTFRCFWGVSPTGDYEADFWAVCELAEISTL
jgi:hypothetical protein